MKVGIGAAAAAVSALAAVAVRDLLQRDHALLRNFPVIGHARHLLESIGPELRQYIVASNNESDRSPVTSAAGSMPRRRRRTTTSVFDNGIYVTRSKRHSGSDDRFLRGRFVLRRTPHQRHPILWTGNPVSGYPHVQGKPTVGAHEIPQL